MVWLPRYFNAISGNVVNSLLCVQVIPITELKRIWNSFNDKSFRKKLGFVLFGFVTRHPRNCDCTKILAQINYSYLVDPEI